jgi:hypothetical protein
LKLAELVAADHPIRMLTKVENGGAGQPKRWRRVVENSLVQGRMIAIKGDGDVAVLLFVIDQMSSQRFAEVMSPDSPRTSNPREPENSAPTTAYKELEIRPWRIARSSRR